ncbi:MAG: RecX family transcriptional regulator [Alistipes sp.]|nr:RecX family transcriptional regulator [Alistipes sp.]
MRTSEMKKPKTRRDKTPDEALAALMRLCARAEKSQSDARRLMRGWGVEASATEEVLARLVRERFIDDERYATAFVREKMRLSGWGEYKIRAALQRKEIDRTTIEEALAATDRTGTAERLRTQLERKTRMIHYGTRYELKTKLIRYGLALGYDYETVYETVATLVSDNEPCDDF